MDEIDLVKITTDNQKSAAQCWRADLLSRIYDAADDYKLIPRDIELTMRNPAVYANRMETGKVSAALSTVKGDFLRNGEIRGHTS